MKKGFLIALCCLLVAQLTGCSIFGGDTQNLMRPPKATAAKAAVRQDIEKTVGSSVTYKYPQNGEYRSAVIMHDITGDGEDEAIAFYATPSTVQNTTTGITMLVMDQNGATGEWEVIGRFQNPEKSTGLAVDRVCFGDMDGDGKQEIVVGWNASYDNSANVFSIYSFAEGAETLGEEQVQDTYAELVMADITADGKSDLLAISVSSTITVTPETEEDVPVTQTVPASARLWQMEEETRELVSTGTVDLNPDTTRYLSVIFGGIDREQVGVVLDSTQQSNTLFTQLVYWDKNQECLVAYDNISQRSMSTVSMDMDGDGLIEIPVVSPMQGYRGQREASGACMITQWCNFDIELQELEPKRSMIINAADGYWFDISNSWINDVTARMESDKRSLTFYVYEEDLFGVGSQGDELLTIQLFSKREWGENGVEGFELLQEKGDTVYAAKVGRADLKWSITMNEVRKNFQLVS